MATAISAWFLAPVFVAIPPSTATRRSCMPEARTAATALIERYYHTFNTGDREAFLALLAENVVHDINQGRSEHGKSAFRTFLERMDRCYREQVEELAVMAHENGTRGAAEFYIQGAYIATDEGLPPATGQTYRLRVGAFFEIKDGLVSRVTNYYNLQDWITQVVGE
jgi:steroid delta-isomerase-like uncharacterized protein